MNEDKTDGDDEILVESIEADSKEEYIYIEKHVDLNRPLNYSSRGFGFLLNSGQGSSPNSVLVKQNDGTIIELHQNYAQIVVVEPG